MSAITFRKTGYEHYKLTKRAASILNGCQSKHLTTKTIYEKVTNKQMQILKFRQIIIILLKKTWYLTLCHKKWLTLIYIYFTDERHLHSFSFKNSHATIILMRTHDGSLCLTLKVNSNADYF